VVFFQNASRIMLKGMIAAVVTFAVIGPKYTVAQQKKYSYPNTPNKTSKNK